MCGVYIDTKVDCISTTSLGVVLLNTGCEPVLPPGGLLIPPQGYGPLHWGMPLPPHQGQPFYGGTFPGARPQAPSVPIGSHNQFVPLQVGAPGPVSIVHIKSPQQKSYLYGQKMHINSILGFHHRLTQTNDHD